MVCKSQGRYFADVLCGIFGVDPEHSNFAMLKAYLDESGIHGDASVCVVAGFVARASFCDDLHVAWGHLLREYRISEFHAKRLSKRRKPFLGWGDEQAGRFEIAAINVIRDCLRGNSLSNEKPVFVGAAIDRKAFLSHSLDQRRWLTGGCQSHSGKWKRQGAPTKPYFVPFQQCIVDVAKFAPTKERINFVFDWQTDYE